MDPTNPKDTLGDKLRDKGRGDEDLYIAQMERERLDRLKKAAPPAAGSGTCPRDGARLVARTEHGETVQECPTCGGFWLDKGVVEAIVKHEQEHGATRWVRSLLGR